MFVLQFFLTQPFRGPVNVAHILRFGRHVLKSHQATQITVGQDSNRACGLAGISSVYICDHGATTSCQTPSLLNHNMTNVSVVSCFDKMISFPQRALRLSVLDAELHLALIFATLCL